jgi:hypothetical protein
MNPQNPQINGQYDVVKRLQETDAKHKELVNTPFDPLVPRDEKLWGKIQDAGHDVSAAASNVPTDDLVKHLSRDTDPSWHIAGEVMHGRDDVTQDHLSQLTMHSDPELSHMASRHKNATIEHKAMHALLHGSTCETCNPPTWTKY